MPRARSQPRPYHHGSLREALVAASLAILDEEGIAGLTLRSAARRVGVSHAAPKNHFGDLRGLLHAVAAAGFQRLAEAMRRAGASATDPVTRLVEIGGAYVRFARSAPGQFRAMFHPSLGAREPGSELERASSAALEVLVAAMREAQRAGRVRAGDPISASLAAWSLVHGLATLALDGQLTTKGLPDDTEALARALGTMLYEGLRAADSPRPRARPQRRATTRR